MDSTATDGQQAGSPLGLGLSEGLGLHATERADFERHAAGLGYNVDPDTRKGREGGYWSSHTHLMWETWQAAKCPKPGTHTFGSVMLTALETIATLPLQEQDNMMAANMRHVARMALACRPNA